MVKTYEDMAIFCLMDFDTSHYNGGKCSGWLFQSRLIIRTGQIWHFFKKLLLDESKKLYSHLIIEKNLKIPGQIGILGPHTLLEMSDI